MLHTFDNGLRDFRLIGRAGGYVLDIDRQRVDIHRFRSLAEDAERCNVPEQQRKLLRSALQLWRGDLLGGGMRGEIYESLRWQIDSERLTIAEILFDIEIRLGLEQRVADEILAWSMRHPTREGLLRLALLALHRSGRSAEAVHEYERWRRWLADELGVDPSSEVQETALSILRGDAGSPAVKIPPTDTADLPAGSQTAMSGAFRPARPRTLPPDIHDFAGRNVEVNQLSRLLSRQRSEAVVVALSGPGGVGKTALSVHVGHMMVDKFPDGQLYVDLRTAGHGAPMSATDVVGRVLKALGIDGSNLPSIAEDRIDLYRQLLADRKILLVLDNAASDDQVRPLVPASSGAALIVNSRNRLGAAIAADMIALSVLPEDEAVSLLSAIVGPRRLSADELTVRQLCNHCGRLPLALRIAGAKLRAKPHWTVHTFTRQLADERSRLDHLRYGQLDVRSSMSLSYNDLTPDAQRLLRTLGDFGLPEITNWAAAALLDLDLAASESLLEQLVEVQLLEFSGHDPFVGPRYRMHDLVRLFAGERAQLDDGFLSLAAARARLYGAYLALGNQAHTGLFGHFYPNVGQPIVQQVSSALGTTVADQPLVWLETEQQNLSAVMRHAALDGAGITCWQVASTFSPLLEAARAFDDWLNLLETGAPAVRTADDSFGDAVLKYWLGRLWMSRLSNDESWTLYEAAQRRFQEVADSHAGAVVSLDMAVIERFRGNAEAALKLYHQALPFLRQHSDFVREAIGLRGIGQIYLEKLDYATADYWLLAGMEAYERSGYRSGRAQGLFWLGMLRIKQGQLEEAEQLLDQALTICRAVGDRGGEAQTLRGVGLCLQAAGRVEAARSILLEALQLVKQPRPTLIESYILRSIDGLPTSPGHHSSDGLTSPMAGVASAG